MPGQWPSFVGVVLWQMPQACTRSRACPAPGLGISRSTISKSAPALGTCATFIFAIETLLLLFWIHAQNMDARPAQTDAFFHAAEVAGDEELCGKNYKKSFAEISEAMHRHSG